MATEFKAMNDLFKVFSTQFAKAEGKKPWELSEKDVEKFLDFVEKFNKISKTSVTDEPDIKDEDEYKDAAEVERQSEPEWNPDEEIKALKDKYSAYAPGVWVKNVDNTSEDNPNGYRKYGYIRSVGHTIDYKAKEVNPYIVITWLEDTAIDSAASYAAVNKTCLLSEDKFKIIPSITSIDFIKKLVGKIMMYDSKLVEYATSAELITRVAKHTRKELLIINGWYITSLIWDRRGKLLNTTIDGKPILQALFEEA